MYKKKESILGFLKVFLLWEILFTDKKKKLSLKKTQRKLIFGNVPALKSLSQKNHQNKSALDCNFNATSSHFLVSDYCVYPFIQTILKIRLLCSVSFINIELTFVFMLIEWWVKWVASWLTLLPPRWVYIQGGS